MIAAIFVYVYSHSRAQFHPAALVLLYGALYAGLFAILLMLASWLFVAIGQPGLRINYETIGYLVGPLTFGELVRGHVRHWLGYYPAEYCFPAIAAGGLSAGALFGGFMMLRWAELTWVEPIIWGALGAALYLLVGWLMRLDERKKSRSVR